MTGKAPSHQMSQQRWKPRWSKHETIIPHVVRSVHQQIWLWWKRPAGLVRWHYQWRKAGLQCGAVARSMVNTRRMALVSSCIMFKTHLILNLTIADIVTFTMLCPIGDVSGWLLDTFVKYRHTQWHGKKEGATDLGINFDHELANPRHHYNVWFHNPPPWTTRTICTVSNVNYVCELYVTIGLASGLKWLPKWFQ